MSRLSYEQNLEVDLSLRGLREDDFLLQGQLSGSYTFPGTFAVRDFTSSLKNNKNSLTSGSLQCLLIYQKLISYVSSLQNITVPKFEMSQLEALSTVLISWNIKSLT